MTSVAALAMLLANASNPYLQAVGHGWSIALVIGVANALSRTSPGARELPETDIGSPELAST